MGWGTGNIGGGSGGLNFKVVGNPQPANPKENTIWLNTDVKITGCYFQAEQPDEMAEGEVWISTGTGSHVAFNALKKDTIMVYPLKAKQYVSGAWVDVTAKIYQGGEWVDWVTWVYKDGTTYTDIVSGWSEKKGVGGYINWESDRIAISHGSDKRYASFYSDNGIEVGKFKKLCIDISPATIATGASGVRIGLRTTSNTTGAFESNSSGYAAVIEFKTSTVERQILQIDISALTGAYHFQAEFGATMCDIYKIYFA